MYENSIFQHEVFDCMTDIMEYYILNILQSLAESYKYKNKTINQTCSHRSHFTGTPVALGGEAGLVTAVELGTLAIGVLLLVVGLEMIVLLLR